MRELRGLPPATKIAVREAMRRLAEDPLGRHRLLDVKQLDLVRREEPMCRLRVGDWRVVYAVRSREVLALRVLHRSEGHRRLDTFRL